MIKTTRIPTPIEDQRFMKFDRYDNFVSVSIRDNGEEYTLKLDYSNLSRPMEDIIFEMREACLYKKNLKEGLRAIEGWS